MSGDGRYEAILRRILLELLEEQRKQTQLLLEIRKNLKGW